jgi:uncharacterized membrane protein YagU involved in acid resistance
MNVTLFALGILAGIVNAILSSGWSRTSSNPRRPRRPRPPRRRRPPPPPERNTPGQTASRSPSEDPG